MISIMPQDFSGKNLQGRSFKGQDLTSANFNNADIRGTDFTNAILKNTSFRNAKAGMKSYWAALLIVVSLFLSAISGYASWIAGVIALESLPKSSAPLFTNLPNVEYGIPGAIPIVIVIVVLTAFFFAIIRHGFTDAMVPIAGIASGIVVVVGAVSVARFGGEGLKAIGEGAWRSAAVAIWALAGTITGALAVFNSAFETRAVTLTLAVFKIGAGASAMVIAVFIYYRMSPPTAFNLPVLPITVAIIMAVILLSIYAGRRALAGDEKFVLIRKFAIAYTAKGGTNFYNANLTDSDFTGATLKSTDFRKATFLRTCWHNAKKLDLARVGGSILTQASVRDLLVSGNGYKKSYVNANLKGANLAGANLSEANLKEVDINEATFEGANLEGVNLTRSQAIGTNFTKAYLTGACLEGWNIDSTTKMDEVDCRWVYLSEFERSGSNQRGERRPSSGEFKPGEFTKLFQVVLNTVDLIFSNGVDWRAFATAFKKVQVENEDTYLEIQSIEKKGDGVVVVKVSVPPNINKEKIHREITQTYGLAFKVLEENLKADLRIYAEQELKRLLTKFNNNTKGKYVIIRVEDGNFDIGFTITLRIGVEGESAYLEDKGELPASRDMLDYYRQWQLTYYELLESLSPIRVSANSRIKVQETQITNVAVKDFSEKCSDSAKHLKKQINDWLNSQQFRKLKEKLLSESAGSDSIRVILQTEDRNLRQLPWHLWDFFEEHSNTEITLATTVFQQRTNKSLASKSKVRILAILGNSTNINVEKDREYLEKLSFAETVVLVEPQMHEVSKELWEKQWDILFFAGHSRSIGKTGWIDINSNESLTIGELKRGLATAIDRGLKLAIFNSCDGLGLALELQNLNILNVIVMREPVPDYIAQKFLMYFLKFFEDNQPLHLAVRKARERLQEEKLDSMLPGVTWLPVICQQPSETPLTLPELI